MGNRQSYKKIAKNATSLAIVFVMMAVIAIRRDGMLFGYRMIEDKAHSIAGIERLEDGSIMVNTSQLDLDIRGYNGPVPLKIRIDPSGKVASIAVMDNSESPEFLQHALDGGLLEQWIGRDAGQILAATDADAVSGATYSSKAIIANVRAGLAAALDRPYEPAKTTTPATSGVKSAQDASKAENGTYETPSHTQQAKNDGTPTAAHNPTADNASTSKPETANTDRKQTIDTENSDDKRPHSFIVNTIETGKDIRGFSGPVPIQIEVSAKGHIISITALPNDETPRFFERVTRAALTDTFVGMSVRQALASEMPDAVSGATYSSKALIANMRQAFEQARDTLASFHDTSSKASTADKQARHPVKQTQQASNEADSTTVNSTIVTTQSPSAASTSAEATKLTPEQAHTPKPHKTTTPPPSKRQRHRLGHGN